MASDRQLPRRAPLAELAQLCLDPESPPNDAAKRHAGASAPSLAAVTVTELPSPPAPPPAASVDAVAAAATEAVAAAAAAAAAPEPASQPPASTFTSFPLLPAELRLKIWHMSFLPRTVELHTRRSHYANDDNHRGTPKWQSQSRNPAALSVNVESRAAALEFYRVALTLFEAPSRAPTDEWPGDLLQLSDRLLFLNLEQDTVVLLGDLDYTRLTRSLEWFRNMDKPPRGRRGAGGGKGLRRLAMSAASWPPEVGAATLKVYARTVFADIEEFVLFVSHVRLPPPGWTGGLCVLTEAAADTDYYRRFVIDRGRQFRVGGDWMAVGKRPMKVADISFEAGW